MQPTGSHRQDGDDGGFELAEGLGRLELGKQGLVPHKAGITEPW